MKTYTLSHLSDPVLLRDLAAAVARSSTATADVLAHIAEVDVRKLYLPAAYSSMYAYCVGELRLSEDAAFKRIQAARVARRFPVVFHAVAAGRLHLSAIGLLAAHLTEENADELLTAATHRTKREIEQLLAERFPQPDVMAWVEAIPVSRAPHSEAQLAPGQVGTDLQHVSNRVGEAPQLAPGQVGADLRQAPEPVGDRSRVRPLAPQRFAVQFTMSQGAHDKLRYAQELLGHQIPSGDIAAVVEQALDALVEQLEKRKFAATSRPVRSTRRGTASPRHIPAHVKRAVWERDGGQCTFESEACRRCPSRTRLEFDHVEAVARGGEATVSGIRLRCRAHNQYAAECTFGPEFMRHKKIAAAEARAAEKARASGAEAKVAAQAGAADRTSQVADNRDVIPWLRQLGFSASEARRGAARCEDIPDASLEQRIRLALSCIGVRGTRMSPTGEAPGATAAPADCATGRDGP